MNFVLLHHDCVTYKSFLQECHLFPSDLRSVECWPIPTAYLHTYNLCVLIKFNLWTSTYSYNKSGICHVWFAEAQYQGSVSSSMWEDWLHIHLSPFTRQCVFSREGNSYVNTTLRFSASPYCLDIYLIRCIYTDTSSPPPLSLSLSLPVPPQIPMTM